MRKIWICIIAATTKVCRGQLGWMTGSAGIFPAAPASALTSDTCGVKNNKKMAVGRFLNALCSCQSKSYECACLWVDEYWYATPALDSFLGMQRAKPRFPRAIHFDGWEEIEALNAAPTEDGKQDLLEMVNAWHILACRVLSAAVAGKVGQLLFKHERNLVTLIFQDIQFMRQ